jgi:NADH:ubiquinone oxidoreductase subunit 6 (subunit J)
MFAKAEDKDYFINGFNKMKTYSDFESYYKSLKADYSEVHQKYLTNAAIVKAEMNILKQAGDINMAISVNKKQHDLNELQKSVKSYKTESTEFNITMNLFYLLFFATFVIMILFLLWNVLTNIKSNIGMLAGIGVLVLLVILGFAMASPELTPAAVKEQLDANNMKWVGAGLFTFYCMFFGTIAAILVSLILNAVKKVK